MPSESTYLRPNFRPEAVKIINAHLPAAPAGPAQKIINAHPPAAPAGPAQRGTPTRPAAGALSSRPSQ
jgi:hypothetical protein